MRKIKYAVFIATLSLGMAQAATPVGTFIQNQASAEYTDPEGGPQTATSNTVYTTTAPLAGVSLIHSAGGADEDNPASVTGAGHTFLKSPGEQVVVPYVLSNTGNVTNSYALSTFVDKPNSANPLETLTVTYYRDVNGDGLLDGGDTVISGPIQLFADDPSTVGNDGSSQKILMVYTLPNTGAVIGDTLVIEPVATAQKTTEPVFLKNPDGTVSVTATNLPVVAVTDGKRIDNGDGSPSTKADVQPDGTVEPAGTNVPDNFHKVTIQTGAVVNVTKTVSAYSTNGGTSFTPGVPSTPLKVGDVLKYTVVATNTGNQAANSVVFSDTLQAGTTFVSGVFTPAGGVGTSVTASGQVVTGTYVGNIPAGGGTVSLELTVTISALANVDVDPENDPVVNAASVNYVDAVTGQPPTTPPSGAITTPVDVAGGQIGPKDKPLGDAAGGSGDDYNQTQPIPAGASSAPVYTVVADSDAQTIASAGLASGAPTQVVFFNTVQNTGTSSDTFNLAASVTPASAAWPAGTTVTFYKDNGDGVLGLGDTPITATDAVAAGGSFSFLTVVTFPSTTSATTTDVDVTITTTSVDNGSVTNTTRDVIGALTKGLTAGNDTSANGTPSSGYDNNGAVDSTALETQPGTAGSPVTFPMDLVNSGSSPSTVTLAGTVTFLDTIGNPLPPVAVQYYDKCLDVNNDGILTALEIANPPLGCSNTPLTQVVVNPGQEVTVLAYIPVPAAAGSGTALVNQTFTDTTNGNVVVPTPVNEISVSANNFTFTADNTSTITTSGSVVYTHTLTNLTSSANTITSFTLAASGVLDAGDIGVQSKFDVYYSIDGGTTYVLLPAGSTSSTITLATPLTAGASQNVLIKVVNKGGSEIGDQNQVVLTVNPSYGLGNPDPANQSVNDTTKVEIANTVFTVDTNGDGIPDPVDLDGDGIFGEPGDDNPINYALVPIKTADKKTAKPGESITYTIKVKNNRVSAANLLGAIVKDVVPANTEFVSVTASITGQSGGTIVYSTDAGGTWSSTAPTAPTTTQVWVGYDTNVSTSITASPAASADTLAPGAEITMTLVVKVK